MDYTKELRENARQLESDLTKLFREFYEENGDVHIKVKSYKDFITSEKHPRPKLVNSYVKVRLSVGTDD